MPGENPFMEEFRRRFGIPETATRGGAETAYPEFARTLETGGAQ
jgi:hypothetical protein